MPVQGSVQVTAELTNTGSHSAAQVVQLYLQATVANPTRPERELKGFQRVELQPGESRKVEFTLNATHLGSYSAQGDWLPPKGQFQIALGFDSTTPFTHKIELIE